MDIIKKLIDDFDIEFSINDKINECIIYYKKTNEKRIKYNFVMIFMIKK